MLVACSLPALRLLTWLNSRLLVATLLCHVSQWKNQCIVYLICVCVFVELSYILYIGLGYVNQYLAVT